jgi:hypothetical protein
MEMTVKNSQTDLCDLILSNHVIERMSQRSVSFEMIRQTVTYGRVFFEAGDVKYFIGYKEVLCFKKEGVDLSSCQGLHVICAGLVVITTFRNRKLQHFKRNGK